jgi:outer membrane protein TolC
MKKLLTLLCLLYSVEKINGQNQQILTLEESYSLARQHYPMIKQRDLISKSEAYSVSNAAKGILPVFTVNGQGSHQSDVTQIPISSPEMNMEPLSKNQYKVYGELVSNLYDGGVIRNQKDSHKAAAKVEDQKLEVELYKIKERINHLFFGVLLLDAQMEQNELLKQDIQRGILQTDAAIAYGTALKSSGDVLQAELLKAKQKTIELSATRTAFIEMLGLMIGRELNRSTLFSKPKTLEVTGEINRPELLLYDYQQGAIDVQENMLASRNRPRLSAFFQGGYGRPALNMLDNTPQAFYITGLRLHWTISGFYTYKKEKALLDISRQNIELQKQTFVYNTNLTLKNQQGEVDKLQDVLASDDEIIRLRERIKQTASAQLGNGVINSNDYLREVTAEDQARHSKILHEIQLLLAQYTLQTTAGL